MVDRDRDLRPHVRPSNYERVMDHGRGGDNFDRSLSRVLEKVEQLEEATPP